MSKEIGQVFGGIGDAVGGVLKGVGDAVDGAVKGVGSLAKQIYESKIGKAIIIAGAIYFGGAALAGGFGTVGTSTSFLSGMGAGVSTAATSLEAAWTLAGQGEFAAAAGKIGGSYGAAFDAGAGITAAPTTAALTSATTVASAPAAAPVTAGAPGVLNPAAAELYTPVAQTAAGAGAPAATQPWYAQALDYITPKSELAQYGLISGAATIGGNLIAGIGQQQAVEDQRNYEAEQLQAAQDTRNANVGAELFAPGQYAAAPGPAPAPAGLARRYMPQVAPGSPGYVPGSQFAQAYNRLPPGMGLGQYVMRG